MDRCTQILSELYGDDHSWNALWDHWYPVWFEKSKHFRQSERDAVCSEALVLLICYGDSLISENEEEVPLKTLYRFLDEMCDLAISGVHILPFFPYSSDDGFSISDYRRVREDLGSWQDIEDLSDEYHFMTDLVLNHCSSKHEWFKKFLASEAPYDEYFVTGDPHADYSDVVRPRPHFVLSPFETAKGTRHVWTTFSKDQVDINFANPKVLFEMLDTMLEYVIDHKSRLIRLDAIAYLWKEIGTPCIHHHNTHLVVKLMRALLDHLVPDTIIITETNVPHEENISYFGDNDEAQMVYQFPLPPLLLHSMITQSTSHLSTWARNIPQPNENISYFNFCASHDGIGLTPSHGILSLQEREELIKTIKARGGLVSYKSTPKGEIPYELNINYLSACAPVDLPDAERAKIFLASQSVLLSMPGVPGIYIHSLLGSENWNHGVKETGHNRTINRQKLDYEEIVRELNTEGSLRNLVFTGYLDMIRARSKSTAFHPACPAHVLEVHDGLFALIRDAGLTQDSEKVLCLVNLSAKELTQSFASDILPWSEGGEDLRSGDITFFSKTKDKAGHSIYEVTIEPYEILWLRFRV